MKGMLKPVGFGIAISFFSLMLMFIPSTAQTDSDSLFGSTPDSTSDL